MYRHSLTLYSTNRRGLGIVHHYSPVRAQLQSICRSDGIQSVEQWAQPRVHDREQVNEISQMLETRLNGILMTSLMGHQLTTTKAHLANPNSMQRQTRRETLCQVRLLFYSKSSIGKLNSSPEITSDSSCAALLHLLSIANSWDGDVTATRAFAVVR